MASVTVTRQAPIWAPRRGQLRRLRRLSILLVVLSLTTSMAAVPVSAQSEGDSTTTTDCGPLACSEVLVATPYQLDFSTDHGKILDGRGVGTGFTYVDPPTNGTGYLPEKLEMDTAAGHLKIATTGGIASDQENSLDNGLGVGVDAASAPLLVETRLVNPPKGTGKYEQAGLWFGNDEDNYVKLVVQSGPKGTRTEVLLETSGSRAAQHLVPTEDLSSSNVDLELRTDPATLEIVGRFRVNDGSWQTVGTVSAPSSLFSIDGVGVDPAIGTNTFAGIFATHRKGNSSLIYTFDSFDVAAETVTSLAFDPPSMAFSLNSDDAPASQVAQLADASGAAAAFDLVDDATWLQVSPTSGTTPAEITVTADPAGLAAGEYDATVVARVDGTDQTSLAVSLTVGNTGGCAPLACSEILVGLPYQLDFASDHGKILDQAGIGTGFTYVDQPSNGTGYIRDNLSMDLANGHLKIETTAGLASGSDNSLDNGLGVGLSAATQVIRLTTRLVNPPQGTGQYEQAGLWFGNDEDNYAKLVIQSTADGTRNELLLETQGSRAAQHVVATGDLSVSTVDLEMVADPFTLTVTGRYRVDDGPWQTVGTVSAPSSLFSIDGVGVDPAIGTNTFGGIFASHRNAGKAMVYTFDSFEAVRHDDPSLVFEPASLSFALDSAAATQSVQLTTDDAAEASFTLTDDATWLAVSPTSGNTPHTIDITADPSGLVDGEYTATVTATGDDFLPAALKVTMTVGDTEGCSPLACSEIMVASPYELDFSEDHGKILDRNGVGTGFTYIDWPTNGTGYIRENLEVDHSAGVLHIKTTAGLQVDSTNSLDNAIGVGIEPPSQITEVSTTVVKPPKGTGNYEQGGLWFGNDEDNYIKLVIQSSPTGTRNELLLEVHGGRTNQKVTGVLTLDTSHVGLLLRADPVNRTVSGYYRINDGPYVHLGTFDVPGEFFSFDAAGIDQRIGTRTFGGIFASHRHGAGPLTYTFDHFLVDRGASAPPQTHIGFDQSSFPVDNPTSMVWGPDNRLYVTELMGEIHAITLDQGGNPIADELISSLGSRLTLGITVDPASTPDNVVLWVAHSGPSLNDGEENSSTVSRLSGSGFTTVEHIITGLPRAIANHSVNSLHFGPDGRLYVAVGGNTGAGAPNLEATEFGDRPEQPLSAALLVADVKQTGFQGECATPVGQFGIPSTCDVRTHATGLRNMYDFVFHSNGQLYGPDNGLGVTGTYPPQPEPDCTGLADADLHNPGEQPDSLIRIEQGIYYGHPNPYRNECVFGDGTKQGVAPLANYKPPMHSLGMNKSANGILEYENSQAFCGELAGDLLLANYSVGDDITRVQLSEDGMSVVATHSIVSGFKDPLPLAQDPQGNIYVGELGGSRITVLKPVDTGCWSSRAPRPEKVLDARGAALDGKFYAVAGKTSAGHITSVGVYDPATDTWSSAPDLPGAGVEDVAVAVYNGNLYAFGGATSPFSGQVTDARVYDPGSQTWTMIEPMPTPRSAAAAGVVGDKIYVVGGMDADGASVPTVDIYDPATNTWATGPPLAMRRDNAGAAVLDGRLYVFGGRTRNADGTTVDGQLATVEMLDLSTNSWVARAPMPTGRRTFVVGTLNGRAQVIGGEAAPDGSAFDQNEEYDPTTDSWRVLNPLATPRHGAAGATIDGVIYHAGGGVVAGGSFSDIHDAFTFPSAGGG